MKFDYEKFKSLEISQEEVDAIRKYISFMHTNMNSMLDLNPEVLTKLKDKAWLIDLSKDSMKEHIDSFEKIYSAMYKYGKKHNGPYERLYRGTSRDEIDNLREGSKYGRFLSTSTDESTARTFVEYGNGAIVSIQLGNNMPHLKMDEFLGETQVSESEILLAPYCKIGAVTKHMVPPEGESRRYTLGLSKAEFSNISDEERAKCEEMINSFDLNKELEEYKHWTLELEAAEMRVERFTPTNSKDDLEEAKFLSDKRNEARDKVIELQTRFDKIKESMNMYLQDKFKSIEIEIDKEIQKEEVVKEEEFRVSKVEEFRSSKEKLLEKSQGVLDSISATQNSYFEKDEEQKELMELAENTNTYIGNENQSEHEIVERFETLKANIESIKQEILAMEIPDDLTMEDMQVKGPLMSKINEKYSQLEMVDKLIAQCQEGINLEKQDTKTGINQKIAEKVKHSMTNKAIIDLVTQRDNLVAKKDSIIDRITGKAKLKRAQIENLNLKVNIIKEKGLNIPNDIKGIEEYLKKYSQVLGVENLSTDAQTLLKNSLKDAKMPELTQEDAEEFQLYFNPNMPTIANKDKSIKNMLKSIVEQTQRLQQVQAEAVSKEETTSSFDRELENNTDSYNIEDTLDMAIGYSKKDDRSAEKKREELDKNKTVDLFNKF